MRLDFQTTVGSSHFRSLSLLLRYGHTVTSIEYGGVGGKSGPMKRATGCYRIWRLKSRVARERTWTTAIVHDTGHSFGFPEMVAPLRPSGSKSSHSPGRPRRFTRSCARHRREPLGVGAVHLGGDTPSTLRRCSARFTRQLFGSQSLDPPPLLGPVPRCRCSVSHALSCRNSTPCDTQRPLDPSAWRRSAHSRKDNRSGD